MSLPQIISSKYIYINKNKYVPDGEHKIFGYDGCVYMCMYNIYIYIYEDTGELYKKKLLSTFLSNTIL